MKDQSQHEEGGSPHLSRIGTDLGAIDDARGGSLRKAIKARNVLVMRYHQAIRGYAAYRLTQFSRVLKRDPDAVDNVTGEVVKRLLEGRIVKTFDPERGRFRDLLKVTIKNCVLTYVTPKKQKAGELVEEPADPRGEDDDQEFSRIFRQALLDKAKGRLREVERRQPRSLAHTVICLREELPEATSEELAARLGRATKQQITSASLRQTLCRARKHFADCIRMEISETLADPTPERIEDELRELGLFTYIRELLSD